MYLKPFREHIDPLQILDYQRSHHGYLMATDTETGASSRLKVIVRFEAMRNTAVPGFGVGIRKSPDVKVVDKVHCRPLEANDPVEANPVDMAAVGAGEEDVVHNQ